MAVLVIAEHHHGALSDATHKVVTAASKFGGDVDLLVAGENAGAVAPEAAKVSGVRKVLKAEGESLRKQTAEAMEALVVPLMANYDAVFIAATTTGAWSFLPRSSIELSTSSACISGRAQWTSSTSPRRVVFSRKPTLSPAQSARWSFFRWLMSKRSAMARESTLGGRHCHGRTLAATAVRPAVTRSAGATGAAPRAAPQGARAAPRSAMEGPFAGDPPHKPR